MRRLNVFGYNSINDENVTEGVNGDRYCDGKEFIVGEIADKDVESVEECEKKVEKLTAKSDAVLPASYLTYILTLLAGIALAVSLRVSSPFRTIFTVVALLFAALAYFMRNRITKVRAELSTQDKAELYPPLAEAIAELDSAEKELLAKYGFDGNSLKADTFHPVYDSDEEYQSYECDKEMLCLPVFIERVGDTLKLSDLGINFDIPFIALKQIVRINKGGSFMKLSERSTLPTTLSDGVTVKRDRNIVTVSFDYYYALVIEKDGSEYELTFPPYELQKLESVTGLSATEPLH